MGWQWADVTGMEPVAPGGIRDGWPTAPAMAFDYVSHRGVDSRRTVRVGQVECAVTEFRPEPHWVLQAWCVERCAERTFDVSKMRNIRLVDTDEEARAEQPEPVASIDGLGVSSWDAVLKVVEAYGASQVDESQGVLGADTPESWGANAATDKILRGLRMLREGAGGDEGDLPEPTDTEALRMQLASLADFVATAELTPDELDTELRSAGLVPDDAVEEVRASVDAAMSEPVADPAGWAPGRAAATWLLGDDWRLYWQSYAVGWVLLHRSRPVALLDIGQHWHRTPFAWANAEIAKASGGGA